MDALFLQKLDVLYRSFQSYDAKQNDRIARYRNIEPDSAQYLAMLIRIQQSKRILEIGTSTGYSTLWLADAAKTTHGSVTTLEIDEARSNQAALHARDFALSDVVEFIVGDAQVFLQTATQTFDFILLDAERDAYVQYWSNLKNLIAEKSGVMVVDNVLSHAEQVNDFIEMVQADGRFVTQTINLGAGLFVICREH